MSAVSARATASSQPLGGSPAAGRREHYAPRAPAAREGDADLGARRQGGGHARHDLDRYAVRAQISELFMRAAEEHRIATLQAHDDAVLVCRVHEPLIDKALRGGMPAAALAYRDLLRAGRELENRFRNECVVKDNVRLAEEARRAQRQQIGGTRSGANQIYGSAHPDRRRKSGSGRFTEAW